jgi:hypothetical protein
MASVYTKKEVEKMTTMYTKNPCLEVVNKLSVLLNKPRKSIISKLVKEGVYVTQGYRTKRGKVPTTKLATVRDIEGALGVKLPGLDKAPKTTLETIAEIIVDQTQTLGFALDDLANASEDNRVLRDMLNSKDTYDHGLDNAAT